jgi:triosephosphate isomerase
MKKNIVAGNWKMNTNLNEGLKIIEELKKEQLPQNILTIIIPPFTHIYPLSEKLKNTNIKIGAQNTASEEKGAYTGEVSAEMLKSAGAEYVIIGHSERRAYFNENNSLLNKKIKLALEQNLTPIYCVGEKLEERETGKHFNIIETQIKEGLFSFAENEISKLIIAYEPVWAIGTGKTASPEQAQEIHEYIRNLIAKQYGNNTAANISILYGGSVKPTNAKEIFANPDVDGGLIGGASLNAQDFLQIIKSF